MEITHIAYFDTVVRSQNFSRAAEIHKVSQPSLSLGVKKLEKELDTPLLSRPRKGRLELTAAGEIFLRHAKVILQEYVGIQRGIDDLNKLHRGVVTVGLSPLVAPHLIQAMTALFTNRFPRLRLEIVEAPALELQGKLDEGTIHAAMVSPTLNAPHLSKERLLDDEVLLCLHREHPLASAGRIEAKALKSLPLVLVQEDLLQSESVQALQANQTLKHSIAVQSNQLATLYKLVQENLAVALVPAIAGPVPDPENVVLHSLTPKLSNIIDLIYPTATPASRAVEAFIDIARALFNLESGDSPAN